MVVVRRQVSRIIFGVNYTNQWDWTYNPNTDFAANNFFTSPLIGPPVTNLGERTKFDWRGEAQFMPGQTLVVGLERQTDRLRTNSTGMLDAFFNYTQTTTTASTGNKAGYIELQSEFAKRFFLVANIRYDDNDSFGPHTTWRACAGVYRSGERIPSSRAATVPASRRRRSPSFTSTTRLTAPSPIRTCSRKRAKATMSASSRRYGTTGSVSA